MRLQKKFWQVNQAILVLMALTACNSRPAYPVMVYEFESDCDGGVKTCFTHDPDPETHQVAFEPDWEQQAAEDGISLDDAGHAIYVKLNSGKSFKFSYHDVDPTPDDLDPLPCKGRLHLKSFRPGTISKRLSSEGDQPPMIPAEMQ